jgi:hypothetical protein
LQHGFARNLAIARERRIDDREPHAGRVARQQAQCGGAPHALSENHEPAGIDIASRPQIRQRRRGVIDDAIERRLTL